MQILVEHFLGKLNPPGLRAAILPSDHRHPPPSGCGHSSLFVEHLNNSIEMIWLVRVGLLGRFYRPVAVVKEGKAPYLSSSVRPSEIE